MHATDPVNRIMSEPVLTIGADESIEEALRLFAVYPVHHLPVVEAGRVVGMLSSADIAKLRFFLPPVGEARDAILKQRWQVRRIMQSPAFVVTQHESAERAAELMTTHGVHSLPVVDSKGTLIGIVTTTDIMSSVLQPPLDRPRMHALEEVAKAAKRYLNGGQDERLHAALLKAIEHADLLEQEAGGAATALYIGG
ncbi:MAG TPA: CBS domain-containing protein [Steroidobacteraceae bacterium]|nr:CBS domain-containing protein [Steroidobacteraceae bacterium]